MLQSRTTHATSQLPRPCRPILNHPELVRSSTLHSRAPSFSALLCPSLMRTFSPTLPPRVLALPAVDLIAMRQCECGLLPARQPTFWRASSGTFCRAFRTWRIAKTPMKHRYRCGYSHPWIRQGQPMHYPTQCCTGLLAVVERVDDIFGSF